MSDALRTIKQPLQMNSLIGVLEKVQHFRYNSSLITGVLEKVHASIRNKTTRQLDELKYLISSVFKKVFTTLDFI